MSGKNKAPSQTIAPTQQAPKWARSSGFTSTPIPDAYFDTTTPVLAKAGHRKAVLILGVVIRESCPAAGEPQWITLPVTDLAERTGFSPAVTGKGLRALVLAGLLDCRPTPNGLPKLLDYRVNLDALDRPNVAAIAQSEGGVA